MSQKKKERGQGAEGADAPLPQEDQDVPVRSSGWDDSAVKVRAQRFPGPAGVTEPLRISMTKESYAALIGHAKESVDREICGVLLGSLCEDDYGLFVSVEAAIRGTTAKAGGTHVTFTQDTWNQIHMERKARYPRLQIVGWYHSHPGFGVEFSDMDMFIQRNFFSGPAQIAFVSDPLGGDEAICANTDTGIRSIGRFWVEGRERRCRMPPAAEGAAESANDPGTSAGLGELTKVVRELEDRIRQLTDAAEKQRTSYYNFLSFLGMLAACCLIVGLGYSIYRAYKLPLEPPQLMQGLGAVVPLKIDGKDALVGVMAVKWDLPPELDNVLVPRSDYLKMAAALKAQEAATRAASQPPGAGSQPASPPVGSQPAATQGK